MRTVTRLAQIHAVLDDIAALVGAPALVEDPHHLLLAYSEHQDPVDEVRACTILERRAAPAVVTWLDGLGLSRAAGPVRVPANPQLGMQPRMCFPLRRDGLLFGYLWFIDADLEMSDFELQRAASSAQALVRLLVPESSDGPHLRAADMRSLLSGSPVESTAPRSTAVQRLTDHRLEVGGRLRVLAIRATGDRPSGSLVRRVLSRTASGLRDLSPVVAVVDDVGRVVLVEAPGPGPADLAERVGGLVAPGVCVGIGDAAEGTVSLPHADRTALQAAACGALWSHLGPVVDWPAAGLYRLVPSAAEADSPLADLVARLRAALRDPGQRHLVSTVEMYLDRAGHAQETAAALTLHRATLYQRLQRFTELTGVDLHQGEERSLVHLALKAVRYTARTGSGPDGDD